MVDGVVDEMVDGVVEKSSWKEGFGFKKEIYRIEKGLAGRTEHTGVVGVIKSSTQLMWRVINGNM